MTMTRQTPNLQKCRKDLDGHFAQEDTQVASRHMETFHIVRHCGNASRNHSAAPHTPTRTTVITIKNEKCRQGRGDIRTRTYSGEEGKRAATLETSLAIALCYDPATQAAELRTQGHTRSQACAPNRRTVEPAQCPLPGDEWITRAACACPGTLFSHKKE